MIFTKLIEALDRHSAALDRNTRVLSSGTSLAVIVEEFTRYLTVEDEVLMQARGDNVKRILGEVGSQTIAEIPFVNHALALRLLRNLPDYA